MTQAKNQVDPQYLSHLNNLLKSGTIKGDRTGTGTRSIFGHQMRFDLSKEFPLLTTKKLFLRGIIHELLWLLKGDTNIKYLVDNDVHIWNEWATEEGDLGPVYGKQWRSWATSDGSEIDQIANVIERLKTNPDCRRLIVSAWNPAVLPDTGVSPQDNVLSGKQALPPCHTLFQFNTRPLSDSRRLAYANARPELRGLNFNDFDAAGVPKYYLDCQLYQRSADFFIGVPFNIASYSLLTMMIAQVVNMIPGDFVHTFGDSHLYSNHIQQAQLQLTREPRRAPKMNIVNRGQGIDDFKIEDFELIRYKPYPAIKAPIAV